MDSSVLTQVLSGQTLPIFYFDIDGVLLDLSRSFSDYTQRYWSMEKGDLKWQMAWKHFLRSDDSACIPALIAPSEFNKFSQKHDVRLITAFPEEQRLRRVNNLSLHGFRYSEIYFVPTIHKAKFIVNRSAGSRIVFVEDDPTPLVQLRKLLPCSKVYQFLPVDGVYQPMDSIPIITSWAEFLAFADPAV